MIGPARGGEIDSTVRQHRPIVGSARDLYSEMIETCPRPPAKRPMSDEGDDAEILGRVRSGDQQALAALFSRHRDRLRRMVDFRLDARLRGRVSTSDVLQESYIDALKRLPHFQADPGVPFFIWLRTVTEQRLIQVHRQHLGAKARDAGKEVRLGQGGAIEASSERMAEIIGDLTSPSQAAQRAEIMADLRG